MTAFAGSPFFELIIISAPFFFATFNFASSKSNAIILAPVTPY